MSPTPRRHAFTLIELLVVVAIIALLIAILLPSLGRARAKAKVTACASNMKQMMNAVAVYANEWTDHIPTAFRDGTGANHYFPYEAWFLTDANNLYSMALLFAPAGMATAAIGGSGQIQDPRVFFCPAQTDPDYMWKGTDNSSRWLTDSAIAGNGNAHMGYQYNMHVSPTADSQGNYPVLYNKLSSFPRNASLLVDLIDSPDNVAHRISQGNATWNLAFADGHVDGIQSGFVATWLNNNSGAITGGSQGSSAIWFTVGGGGVKSLMDDLERR